MADEPNPKSKGSPRRARANRFQAAALARDVSLCPHPEKMAFVTKGDAKRRLQKSSFANREGLRAYRCACGAFHLGNLLRRP